MMKTLILVLGIFCLFKGALSQGYLHSHDLKPHGAFRRQLTATQQSQILSDVQQHQQQQHRFNLHNQGPPTPQKQFLIQQQPSIEVPALQQQNFINQRPPPPNQIRFPPNNIRNNAPSQILQHHTQTNFIPNFNQQSNPHIQRSPQNQLHLSQPNFQQQDPSSLQTNVVKDTNFHAQNFIELQNHYSQRQPQQPQQSQTQAQPQVPLTNQNFIQSQPQFQQQQTQIHQQQPQLQQQQSQIQQQPQLQQQPQIQQQSQLQQQPQVQQQSQLQQQQQSSSHFPVAAATQFSGQQQPQPISTLQSLPQLPQQQFVGSPNFPSFPQFQPNPQIQPSQTFQTFPQIQPVPQFQQFQTAPQITPIQQFQNNIPFQTAPQFPTPPQPVIGTSNFQTAPQIIGSSKLTLDQDAKQRLVQKHEAFVQKQYEKQQNRVKQLHDEFIQKQQSLKEIGSNQRPSLYDQTTPTTKSRPLLPSEAQLFEHALKRYNEEHPTTTISTTTTSEKTTTRTKSAEEQLDILLQAQRKDIYGQLKLESERTRNTKTPKTRTKPTKTLGRDELLKQLRLALAENPPPNLGNKTFDSSDVVLPNGQKVQVIRTSDPSVLSGKRQISSNVLPFSQISNSRKPEQSRLRDSNYREKTKLDIPDQLKQVAPDRTKDLVLPNGQKVEIVRAPDPGASSLNLPSDIASLYSQSLGTETQIISSDDGPPSIEDLARRGLIPEGYEIAGLPGSGSKPSTGPQPKPPVAPKKKPTFVYLEEQPDGSFKIQGVKTSPDGETKTTGSEVESILERIQKGEIKLPPTVKKVQLTSDNRDSSLQSFSARPPFPTVATSTQNVKVTLPSSTVSPYSTLTPLINRESTAHHAAASNTHETTSVPDDYHNHSTYFSSPSSTTSTTTTNAPVTERLVATTAKQSSQQPDLVQILKSNGLFAMAKYLKQSGLDTILNETGPYTIFVPTDKAFKNLLIQLGGPERAEDKFKSNPRLLSGLLLHHVIPGSFEISSLQDEMTGVSLAGTQLRVNQYTMHDQEWNDVLITTINGAMVVSEKQDIKIPQGIAHGIDRVMFPLPVGDLLQTLQSDRENRFTTFLKILSTSGMSEILQNKGIKTYTVFAPTDKAFAAVEPAELEKLTTDKDYAQAFIMRHIMSETLFSAGMRFYQIKDSLQPSKTITIQKTSSGKIKVNESQMITSNIPATNGVIHALDGIL